MLLKAKIPHTIMVSDVSKLVDNEWKANQKFAFSSKYDYSKYGTYEEVDGFFSSPWGF